MVGVGWVVVLLGGVVVLLGGVDEVSATRKTLGDALSAATFPATCASHTWLCIGVSPGTRATGAPEVDS